MKLPSWHPAFEKEKKLPEWHPAFLSQEANWVEKGWVTIGGRHMYFNDESGGGGRGHHGGGGSSGGGKVSGSGFKNIENLKSHEGTDMMRVAQYKRLIQSGHETAPIRVTKEADGKWGVLDGKHRAEAYRQLGHKMVPTIENEKMGEEENKQYDRATEADNEALKRF